MCVGSAVCVRVQAPRYRYEPHRSHEADGRPVKRHTVAFAQRGEPWYDVADCDTMVARVAMFPHPKQWKRGNDLEDDTVFLLCRAMHNLTG